MSSIIRSPAGSPPSPAHAALPGSRKRPSVGGVAGPGAAKRRKQSMLSVSSSNHPLRQTSFPPEENASFSGIRSPSVDTDIVARSVATSMTGGKRGKKGKSAAPEGSVKSGTGGKQGTNADTEAVADGDEGDEDEDEEEDDAGLVEANTKQQAADFRKRIGLLFESADQDQQDRLTMTRQFHLDSGKVRRIVNQTLSQSVPKSVILAINSYSKQFVAELIERAVEIQRHNFMAAKGFPTPDQDDGEDETAARDDKKEEKEEYMGPLTPDSLREALRRIKRDGDFGGVGLEGFSLGLDAAGAKTAALGGRRLFR